MKIFAFFRDRDRRRKELKLAGSVRPVRVKPVDRPKFVFKSLRAGDLHSVVQEGPGQPRIFEPTHVHVRTGKQYMLTNAGERLEVTGDEAYPLAEYEDADGKPYGQRWDRFHDGRFRELPL